MHMNNMDHLVLTVKDMAVSARFYHRVLGMDVVHFNGGRVALRFAQMKINLHQAGHEFEPKADQPTPGSGDLCFITTTPMAQVISELNAQNIPIMQGPVSRTGALGPIVSVYIRDPDQNLIEIANYLTTQQPSDHH